MKKQETKQKQQQNRNNPTASQVKDGLWFDTSRLQRSEMLGALSENFQTTNGIFLLK